MMQLQEMQAVAHVLAERATIRAKAIDDWVSLAMQQPNPREWSEALITSALDRLAHVPESRAVKAEARLQLLDIQRALRSRIGDHQISPRQIA